MKDETTIDRMDQATTQRLAKLRTMPVDTTLLETAIEAKIPRPQSGAAWFFSLRSVRAVAASIAMIGIIGVIVWSLSGGAVLASPATMARFHEDMINGTIPTIKVDTIGDANAQLANQWNRGVQIPDVPADHVMLCCMQSIKDKRVACVLMEKSGVPVTMAVAKAIDMRVPNSQEVIKDRVLYHVQSSGKLNMVMTERDGRWICLIAELPVDDLIDLAGAVQL